MAFQSKGITVFLAQFTRTRYLSQYLHSLIPVLPFSTLDLPVNHVNGEPMENRSNIDESHVLDQLSDLLSIRGSSAIQNPITKTISANQLEIRAVDGFLSPEEKLRGIFLQKIRGRSAIERALTEVGVEITDDVVAKVVNRGNLGAESMVKFFNWAIEQPSIFKDIDTYHIILKALGRRKFFTHMVEMLHDMRMRGISPNSDTLFIVMDSFARARHVCKAIQFFGKLEDFGSKCDTESLNVLLQCLCQRSHVGAANSLLHKMKEKVPFNSMTYNLIIGGWSKSGRISDIERILGEMVAGGFDPNSLTYGYVLEGLGRAGRINEAVEIFENLGKEGHAPDASVYNAMISNFISVGNFDECLKYYKSMLCNSCDPTMDTYVKLISAFLKTRRVADAIEMLDQMLDRGIIPSTGTVTSFIESLCSYGPPYAALMFYKRAKKVGCRISLSAYKLLLKRLSRFGKCGMLLNIWNEMQESGHPSDMEVYEHVINGLCNIGQLDNAVLVIEESLRKGLCPSKLICSKLNNKLLSSNKVEKAYRLLLTIKEARRNDNAQRYWRAKGWHF
ncbi:unnamed protein product [Ilex paraguariensis]|uniref:Pentatricopeptide repeat-containing protein n=1 Tax=Ilex paraguariensis TaxID=185542 RepID=A0ABC8UH36_9AQUA